LLGLMLLLQYLAHLISSTLSDGHDVTAEMFCVMAVIGFITIGAMTYLQYKHDSYPINYVLLAVVTLLVGAFWAVAALFLAKLDPTFKELPYLLIGTSALALGFAAIFVTVLPMCCTIRDRFLVITTLCLGWLVAAGLVASTKWWWGIPLECILIAIGATILLFLGLWLHAGQLLEDCNPDDFASVIIASDSVLLVVCLPCYIFALFLFNCFKEPEEEEQREVAHPAGFA